MSSYTRCWELTLGEHLVSDFTILLDFFFFDFFVLFCSIAT